MDSKANLDTIWKLAALEQGRSVGTAADHFRSLASRLAYLHRKREAAPSDKARAYYGHEIDALFWLLAQHEIASGLNVQARFQVFKAGHAIDFARYDVILMQVRAAIARTAPRMIAA
ncbi:MAG TPA: hypothetical protein VGN72_13250 [Tepidisphaeraceae bacterium]|jgi:hypothetical protein|nr:hypothetical protein [Tepidisphaeraceae bacterium]